MPTCARVSDIVDIPPPQYTDRRHVQQIISGQLGPTEVRMFANDGRVYLNLPLDMAEKFMASASFQLARSFANANKKGWRTGTDNEQTQSSTTSGACENRYQLETTRFDCSTEPPLIGRFARGRDQCLAAHHGLWPPLQRDTCPRFHRGYDNIRFGIVELGISRQKLTFGDVYTMMERHRRDNIEDCLEQLQCNWNFGNQPNYYGYGRTEPRVVDGNLLLRTIVEVSGNSIEQVYDHFSSSTMWRPACRHLDFRKNPSAPFNRFNTSSFGGFLDIAQYHGNFAPEADLLKRPVIESCKFCPTDINICFSSQQQGRLEPQYKLRIAVWQYLGRGESCFENAWLRHCCHIDRLMPLESVGAAHAIYEDATS